MMERVESQLQRLVAQQARKGKRWLEIGCGSGQWLGCLKEWGVPGEAIVGIDLLPERLDAARRAISPPVGLVCAEADHLPFASASFDVALLITTFSSILNPDVRRQAAWEVLRVLQPGGVILWYDFLIRHPGNRDVQAMRRVEIQRLFPQCDAVLQRVTLAPPIARMVAPVSFKLCRQLERIRLLRTHYLGVIRLPN